MPTFNQLVKQGRSKAVYKSKAPVLQKGFNALNNVAIDQSAPQKRGVCTKVTTTTVRMRRKGRGSRSSSRRRRSSRS